MTAPSLTRSPLTSERLHHAKHAYTTRHVDTLRSRGLLLEATPAAGDLVLAQVDRIGQHKRLEDRHGRRATLFPGDEVVVCYGARYAPDQFHAVVPEDLSACHLVAAGGLAGQVQAAHSAMAPPTSLLPLGILLDGAGERINLSQSAAPAGAVAGLPPTIAVVGSSMNSGKTTSAAHLIGGLRRAGLRVGAAKVTGTGAGGDVWLMQDAGAAVVLDFTSAGVPSTYRMGPDEVLRVFRTLLYQLSTAGCDVLVIEVADGIYHAETSALVSSPDFATAVDAVLYAAGDAAGAVTGATWLAGRQLPVLGVTGLLSASPLAAEEARGLVDHPVLSLADLGDPVQALALQQQVAGGREGSFPCPSR
ncbi:P-loop NTPase family protein [Auraticoccus monumenti]|uniref:DUF1611 domain-containing protein n=1 Tax=Auraticoccus monumenti TaxID=675864 RepID=A0A1G6WSN1_9ACTN|nr:DUF1611 domain-containing protein [Auraticoccus monumenti]SDD68821.1 hypothetical protein SAMN04489747_1519 [Auraticoccus monumenti]